MSSREAFARSRASIVIPTFNRADLTRRCLAALRETAPEAEVIVVDNASTDETPELPTAEHEAGRIRAILNDVNRFYGPASNQGARAATRELVVFLNNDTIPRPGWLEALVGCLDRDPAVGAVGARLLYPDGRIQHAGIGFEPRGIPFHPGRLDAGEDPALGVDRDHPAVTGACLLMPRELFFSVGGFDEDYVMYVEDVDLCLRDEFVRAGWARMHARWHGLWPDAVRALPGWPTLLGGVAPDVRLPGTRRFAVAAFADE